MNRLSLALAGGFAALLTGCHSESAGIIAAADIQAAPDQRSARQLNAEPAIEASPAAAELPCESARLLKVRAVEMSEGRIGGPVAPTDENVAQPAGVASSTTYYLSLDCRGKTYVARVLSGTPGFQPDELEAAATLHLRAEDGKVFLKADGGAEFQATLAPGPAPVSPLPGQ
ncbi:MAG: hypothetical protein OEW16_09105 [Gammaproteobacteria bacterium]|nr:hypothetical protein [Gammaproteobacteria bacterium]